MMKWRLRRGSKQATEICFKHDPPCILARRFTRQQDFTQKMLSDFFAVMLVASIWHSAGFCGESDSQSLSDCLRSPCPAVSDFYARQQVNLHSISMGDFLYQKYHKTKIAKIRAKSRKNGCKCAESQLHTFSHSGLVFEKAWLYLDPNWQNIIYSL